MEIISIAISAGIALFAIVILYLTRSNIIDLLDRDVVMYDKNYELKKEALQDAFNCLDLVAQNGTEIKNNPQFTQRAKEAYNALLCTVTSAKLYQEFYRMALDVNAFGYSVEDIEKFKIACRKELISKRKSKNEGFKGAANGVLNPYIGQGKVTPITQPKPQQRPPQSRPAPSVQRPQQRSQIQAKPQDEE